MNSPIRYIFIGLIAIMLYLLYLVGNYTYSEYRVSQYTSELQKQNTLMLEYIETSKKDLETSNTLAYKNKILKSQAGKKNPGESLIYLIDEDTYKKYTEPPEEGISTLLPVESLSISDEQSLISTMTPYQKWIYLLFDKDIR